MRSRHSRGCGAARRIICHAENGVAGVVSQSLRHAMIVTQQGGVAGTPWPWRGGEESLARQGNGVVRKKSLAHHGRGAARRSPGSYVVISLVICISDNIDKTDVTYMCWSCVWLYKIFDNEM